MFFVGFTFKFFCTAVGGFFFILKLVMNGRDLHKKKNCGRLEVKGFWHRENL